MGGVRALSLLACAALAACLSRPVAAADALPPAPVLGKSLGPAKEFSDWYLRADSGAAIAWAPEPKALAPLGGPAPALAVDWARLRDGGFYGVGLGYRLNDFVRLDATAEHRLPARYAARTSYACGLARCVDERRASVQSGVFLANAYFEAITWHGLTPYVGAGLGLARNVAAQVTASGLQAGGGSAAGEGAARWAFAWALMAGVAYEPTEGVHVEMGYRYFDAGRASLGRLACAAGCLGAGQRFAIGSHDVRLGVRFALAEGFPAR
jgi:opacity protein-like surface antigen